MDGVILTPLKQIYNSKGDILHAMKQSDRGFDGFGEVYFSIINIGSIKGWKKHTKMTLNIVVPVGEIEFVIYNETTKEFFSTRLSQNNYQRLTVARGLWMAFRGIDEYNMLLNIASIEHNPDESVSLDIGEIVYEW